MATPPTTKATAAELIEEAHRYLGVVEAFRAAGCEPHWRPEIQGGKENG